MNRSIRSSAARSTFLALVQPLDSIVRRAACRGPRRLAAAPGGDLCLTALTLRRRPGDGRPRPFPGPTHRRPSAGAMDRGALVRRPQSSRTP
jgi:hypothetical protein